MSDDITSKPLSESKEAIYQDGEFIGNIVRETIDWSAFGREPTHEWRPEGTRGKRMAGDRLHAIHRLPRYEYDCTVEEAASRLAETLLGSGVSAWVEGVTVEYYFSKRARFRVTVEKL